ncbi:hypothetical protein BLA60_27870 [Actinophytocola xinjiangensis]|uniref:Alkaline shock family protein YloU n=1 Tax=Actinophytocola xinjiangensis TaxID=485602 RepID=A0A7Z0WKW1_9PSEU|nr:Asp23/Gls24 family envelope stress response protein [Actinophytocola xinjiangensis]OLF07385.1 hypothetical protein BLA60_27870 [Actinophytocola xinjiangensis]
MSETVSSFLGHVTPVPTDDTPDTPDTTDATPTDDAEPGDGPAADADAAGEPAPAHARPAPGLRGTTTVADAVTSKVVTFVAAGIDGVHNLDDLTIDVADEVASITVPLVVEYGRPVKALAEQVRVAVIEAVEQILGLDVATVDVHVTDIHLAA